MSEKIRVLLVDHHERSAKDVKRILKTESAIQVVDLAANGYEAVTKTLSLSPDVVLMSVNMETNLAAVSACKEIDIHSPKTSVILYGMPESDEIIHKAFQMGAVNFLAEDYSPEELIQSVLNASCKKDSIHFSAAKRLRAKMKALMGMEDNLSYLLNVLTQLTPAELNILKMVYNGMRYQEISKILFISTSTMKTHISHILRKFNLENMSQVMELLRTTGLFSIIVTSND